MPRSYWRRWERRNCLKQFRHRLHLNYLEDRVTPAIALMGPYANTDLALLRDTAGAAWATLSAAPTPTGDQVSYFEAPNAWYFNLDNAELNKKLTAAPYEFTPNYSAGFVVSLPRPDGSLQQFHVWEMSIMDEGLAQQFPRFHTYRGQGIDDPTAKLAMDWTDLGFHAQVLSAQGAYYIDPYFHLEQSAYISYYKSDLVNIHEWECAPDIADDPGHVTLAKLSTTTTTTGGDDSGGTANKTLTTNGSTLRNYRLALAANFEYSAFFGGKNTNVASALVSAVNRVTGVYESEVAVRLTLVGGNSALMYTTDNGYTAATDPYTNADGGTMLDENQTEIDSVIGNANYDIGHVFSTGGGGIAGLGVVTITGQKANGVTGQPSPTGDPFWIDYVAHEMGHQFDGNHTFNSSDLSPNRNASTAYEPGSGSTIQAYAGLSPGLDDYQPHSDPYFHSVSLDEISSFVATHPGSDTTSTGNSLPTANAGSNYTIPTGTPFALTAIGTDADIGDVITYDWQQRDKGPAQFLADADNGSSPLFRPFPPTTNPTRTFPQLSDILGNKSTAGEKMYAVARTSTYRVVVRDNRVNGGGFATDDMTLNVVNTGAAFAVTAPNTAVSWTGGGTQAITWNVAGTTANGINTANVKISLSTDGGLTFPTVLAASTTNDGSESLIIPNTPTSQARIKVEAVGNVFFDISNVNFTIVAGSSFSVTSVAPANGAIVTAPFTEVDVTFNANVKASSIGTNDVTVNSPGTVTNAQLLAPQTVRYTLSGLAGEGTVSFNVLNGAVLDTGDVGNNAFSASYAIDYDTTTFTVPLVASGTVGTLAYTGTASGTIGTATDKDSFTINLDAGQVVSVVLSPAASLRGSIQLTGPGGLDQTVSAASNGATVLMQTVAAALAGTYTLTIGSVSSTTGTYTARLDLNSANELEANGGATNGSTGSAQPLSGFVDLGGGTDRTVIRGQGETANSLVNETEGNDSLATANNATGDFGAGANGAFQMLITGSLGTGGDTNDYFKIGPMQTSSPTNDRLTVAISGADGGRGTMEDPGASLYRGSSTATAFATNDDRATDYLDSLVLQQSVPATESDYYVRAQRISGAAGTYQMSLYLQNVSTAPTTGSGLHTEGVGANGQISSAEDAISKWMAVNYSADVNGTISTTSDVDFYRFTFAAGDLVSTFATSAGSADLAIAFYNSGGALLYDEQGISTDLGNNSAMYVYRITSAGDYYVKVSSINSTTGNYTLHTELSTNVTPPAAQTASDYYSFAVTAGQPLSLAIKGLSAGTLNFDLLDDGGGVVGSAIGGSSNFDKTLMYTPSSSGTWFARVTGTSSPTYQLLLTRGAANDSEANDSFATAQALTNNRALGAIVTNNDWYQFPVTAGQVITLTTATPGDGTGEFVNMLDPSIELYDPSGATIAFDDNSGSDGRNSILTKAASATGSYRARIQGAASTTGEYVLGLSLSSDPVPSVSTHVIDDGTNQRSRVTSVTVNFSEPVTLPTNKADAFQLVRTDPTSDTVTVSVDDVVFANSGGTQAILTFTGPGGVIDFESLADGNYTLTVFAGQVLDASSQPMAADFSANLHRLYGDYDNDKTTSLGDFATFRGLFNNGANHAFDFDNDGNVGLSDFGAFRTRFNATLP